MSGESPSPAMDDLKLAGVRYSCAFVLLPGGFGTLDELFGALNLRRTHRLKPFPVILVGSKFWEGLLVWLRDAAVVGGTLTEEDVARITVTDDPAEVVMECHTTLCRRLGVERRVSANPTDAAHRDLGRSRADSTH